MPRFLLILFLLVSCSVSARLVSQNPDPARYMQITEDADIWAQIGNNVMTVGNIRAGQILAVVPGAEDYYEFRFGFGKIGRAHV